MVDLCNHEWRVQFKLLTWISIKCMHCGAEANLKKKYVYILYFVGTLGLLPYLVISNRMMGAFFSLILTLMTYFAMNVIVEYLFYMHLKKCSSSHLSRYLDIDGLKS